MKIVHLFYLLEIELKLESENLFFPDTEKINKNFLMPFKSSMKGLDFLLYQILGGKQKTFKKKK